MTLKEIFGKTATVGPLETFRLVVKQLTHNHNGYRDVLKEIFISESKFIVLDCEKKILGEVLKQAQQVGLVSQGYYFFLTSLDAHTVDLNDFKYGGTNFSAFRMVDVDKPEVQNVIYSIVETMVDQVMPGHADINIPTGNLDTTTALIYDSVTAFSLALHDLTSVQQVHQRALDCTGQSAWAHGNSLVNYMKMVEFVGLSGPINFDTSGLRTQFTLDLVELQSTGLVNVGTWNSLDRLSRNQVEDTIDVVGTTSHMANKSFVITTILSNPFTMLVESPEKKTGNDRFEGMIMDITKALADDLLFNYTFRLVEDGNYGSENEQVPGKWNGMLGEVMDGVADFCIADISITTARAKSFEISTPWLNLGISILYIKPRAAPPSLLAFLDPFSSECWIYTLIMFTLISLLIYVLGRFSPNQWETPPNCIKDPEEYENQYTFLNSFWFTLGALMQQGSDVAPLSLSVRFLAGMWFFFALIMISSYTANLAAFLTVETLERPIENVEQLANQNEIKYGAVKTGSTRKFFEDSENAVFQKISAGMNGPDASEVLVQNNDDGQEKVLKSNGKYAFFMESGLIEYLIEREPCKLDQVGGLLDNKGYGIAFRQGTPYKELLDQAILKIIESGELHKMKVRWWKQRRGGGACEDKAASGGVKSLGLANVVGVFIVTMVGCMIAGVFAVLEFFYGTRQSAKDAGNSWVQEMRDELKFIFQCAGNTKELKSRSCDSASQKSENSHSSRLSLEEPPAFSRRKSNLSTVESPLYKPHVSPLPESLYQTKGGSNLSSQKSGKVSVKDILGDANNDMGNPFESVDES